MILDRSNGIRNGLIRAMASNQFEGVFEVGLGILPQRILRCR